MVFWVFWVGSFGWVFLCQPCLDLSVYSSFRVHLGCLSTRACVELMCVCLQKLFCAPGVSVYKSLCWTYVCPSTGDFVCTWGVCLQESVLHSRVCPSIDGHKSFYVHLGVCLQESVLLLYVCFLCCSWACLSTRACASPVCECLWELCVAPGVVWYRTLTIF